jgi:hypothetical protein
MIMRKLMFILAASLLAMPIGANAAHAAGWPKDTLGTWCGGDVDEKGEIPYGATTENGRCASHDDVLIIQPRSYRYPNANSGKDNVCTYDRLEVRRSADGLTEFAFVATCKDSIGCKWQERATGFAFVTEPLKKGMNIKWTFDNNECD